jgi:hypothetical protein
MKEVISELAPLDRLGPTPAMGGKSMTKWQTPWRAMSVIESTIPNKMKRLIS